MTTRSHRASLVRGALSALAVAGLMLSAATPAFAQAKVETPAAANKAAAKEKQMDKKAAQAAKKTDKKEMAMDKKAAADKAAADKKAAAAKKAADKKAMEKKG